MHSSVHVMTGYSSYFLLLGLSTVCTLRARAFPAVVCPAVRARSGLKHLPPPLQEVPWVPFPAPVRSRGLCLGQRTAFAVRLGISSN